ncbi:hypothetical protein TNCV_4845661 [Trichonephila clavipes]|uniref:Uncharacterized protein n=1 Tax=Trichonephila clavipes TaxID=2585209 RepID=A0A8X6WKY6_TRICX|nr:hypothetical protein TNCV_4845661 [Trichonephila clavipes]
MYTPKILQDPFHNSTLTAHKYGQKTTTAAPIESRTSSGIRKIRRDRPSQDSKEQTAGNTRKRRTIVTGLSTNL